MIEHPDHYSIGAEVFTFIAPMQCRLGRVRNRRVFYMRFGDSPYAVDAMLLMPAAAHGGSVFAVLLDGDESELWKRGDEGVFDVEVKTRRFYFRGQMECENKEALELCCRAIGGLRPVGSPPLTWWQQVKLRARWAWLRRPQVVLRSPV